MKITTNLMQSFCSPAKSAEDVCLWMCLNKHFKSPY